MSNAGDQEGGQVIGKEVTRVYAKRLGLQAETVRDLLQSGWMLKSEFNRPDTFVAPAGRVHATVVKPL